MTCSVGIRRCLFCSVLVYALLWILTATLGTCHVRNACSIKILQAHQSRELEHVKEYSRHEYEKRIDQKILQPGDYYLEVNSYFPFIISVDSQSAFSMKDSLEYFWFFGRINDPDGNPVPKGSDASQGQKR